MRNAVLGIGYPNRYGLHFEAFPCAEYQQREFGLIAGAKEFQGRQFLQRIKAETGLSVRQIDAGIKPEPEIRKAVGKRSATVGAHLAATANYQRALPFCSQQCGNVFRKMLTVGVYGKRILVSLFTGFVKSCFIGVSLAFIKLMRDYRKRWPIGVGHDDLTGHLFQNLWCGVGGTVIYHQHREILRQAAPEHVFQSTGVVISGDDDQGVAHTPRIILAQRSPLARNTETSALEFSEKAHS